MTIDFRKRFKDSPHFKQWHEAVTTEWFISGIQTALLEMQKSLAPPAEMGTAAANEFRMRGAQDIVRIMCNLTETGPERKPQVNQNLDHRI